VRRKQEPSVPSSDAEWDSAISSLLSSLRHDMFHLLNDSYHSADRVEYELRKSSLFSSREGQRWLENLRRLQRSLGDLHTLLALTARLDYSERDKQACDFVKDILEPVILINRRSRLTIKFDPSMRSLPAVVVNVRFALWAIIMLFYVLRDDALVRVSGIQTGETVQIKILLSELPSKENNDSIKYFIAGSRQAGFKTAWLPDRKGFLLTIQSVGEKVE
jgi:hypothetical protein